MISPEKIKLIAQNNKYMVMTICPIDERYYLEMGTNSYDMYTLGHLLSYLRLQITTRENILHTLHNTKFMAVVGDLDCFYAHFNPQTNMLKIGGEYDDYQDQAYFEKAFPKDKSKDFLEYTYPIHLDVFLKLVDKMKFLFDKHTVWIVLYEDEYGKLHLEKYNRNLDYLKNSTPLTKL